MIKSELYWILGPWRGRLAILPHPRGGDWLGDEIGSLRETRIDVVVSTLTDEEISESGLAQEEELCRVIGIEYVTSPIADRGVPSLRKRSAEFIHQLENRLAAGETIAIHCRAGVGRSALLAACLLVMGGLTANAAFERIKLARGCPVPDTDEQRQWVEDLAREFLAGTVSR